MIEFTNLADAIREGWQIFESRQDGYTLRKKIGDAWSLALCKPSASRETNEYR
jgi:hypothetical protein